MNDNDYYSFTVSLDDTGKRIDTYICENISDISRNAVQRLITDNNILVNKKSVNKNYRITGKDIIEVNIPPIQESQVIAENIPLDIKYEDEDLLVVNKPKGMVVHPAVGNESSTLVNALLYHCKGTLSGIGGVARPGIVHRIDRDTTGSVIICKNDKAHLGIAKQLADHSLTREYHALVVGKMPSEDGTVDAPIARSKNDGKKMAVCTGGSGKHAVTHYHVIKYFPDDNISYISCRLETGRTHQIRVHMKYIGHPVIGDVMYNNRLSRFPGASLMLHSSILEINHPTTGERMRFEAPLPERFSELEQKLRES